MKKQVLQMVGCAALFGGLLAGCSGGGEQKQEVLPVAVRTDVLQPGAISEVLQFTGELESPLSVDVAAKTQGRLAKLQVKKEPVTEGTVVKAGDILAEIEHAELEAEVSLAGAQLQQAEVTLADRERERRRIEVLFAEHVSTEQARDSAVTAHESAKAALSQAQAQLKLARVALDEAFIRAPMDGVVAARYVDPGAMVNASTPIVKLVQMDPLRLMISVPARLLPVMVPSETTLNITVDVYPGRIFKCTVNRVFPTVDSVTRTVRVEVLMENEMDSRGSWLFRPGMYATVEIALAVRQDALTIPASSVIRVLDRQVVFVLEGDTARTVDVQTGIRNGDQVEVLSGLNAGDEYVTMGQNKLTDGVTVERVAARQAAH